MRKVNGIDDICKWTKKEIHKIHNKVCEEGGYSYQIRAFSAQLLWLSFISQMLSVITGLTSTLSSLIQIAFLVAIGDFLKKAFDSSAIFGVVTRMINGVTKGSFVYNLGDRLLTRFIYCLIFGNVILLVAPNHRAYGTTKDSNK